MFKFLFKLLFWPFRFVFRHPLLIITSVLGYLGWQKYKKEEEEEFEEIETWEPKEEVKPSAESTQVKEGEGEKPAAG